MVCTPPTAHCQHRDVLHSTSAVHSSRPHRHCSAAGQGWKTWKMDTMAITPISWDIAPGPQDPMTMFVDVWDVETTEGNVDDTIPIHSAHLKQTIHWVGCWATFLQENGDSQAVYCFGDDAYFAQHSNGIAGAGSKELRALDCPIVPTWVRWRAENPTSPQTLLASEGFNLKHLQQTSTWTLMQAPFCGTKLQNWQGRTIGMGNPVANLIPSWQGNIMWAEGVNASIQ